MEEKKIFFTADHHFGHKNIIKLADRPFLSLDEMDETMITKWNLSVDVLDDVYHLGDFGFKTPKRKLNEILIRLNGQKYLIKGNHDKDKLDGFYKEHFHWIKHYQDLDIDGKRIILFHYPIQSWGGMHRGAWHLHGHCHGKLTPKAGRLDVGVDAHKFKPIEINELKNLIVNRKDD